MAGNWNQLILSPKWLVKNISILKGADEPPVEVQLPDLIPRLKISFPNVVIMPEQDMVLVYPKKLSPQSFNEVQQICREIFQNLPHTPLKAIGHNFTFNLESGEELKTNKLILDDSIKSALNKDLSSRLKEEKCSFKLISSLSFQDTPFDLNIHFEKSASDQYRIQFNFHCESARIEKVGPLNVIDQFTPNREIAEDMFSNLVNAK